MMKISFHNKKGIILKNLMCDKNKCNVCKNKVDEFHIDHIMPLAAGGNNDLDNLQVLCLECHQEKTRTKRWMTHSTLC